MSVKPFCTFFMSLSLGSKFGKSGFRHKASSQE
jgi:hypothetical protein